MAAKVLRDEILGITQLNSRGQKFVPFSDLANILTQDKILSVLRHDLSVPHHARHEYATTVVKDFMKVFSILLVIGHADSIIKVFVQPRLVDSKLPFGKEQLTALPEPIRNGFSLEQNAFLSPELCKGMVHRVMMYDVVLPFLEEQALEGGEGAFGLVYKIRIHPEYQKLLVAQPDSHERLWFVRKEIKRHSDMVTDFDAEKRALEMLMQVRHKNIIELLMTYTHRGAYNLIFPWAEMDLRTFLQTSSVPASQGERLPIWRQIQNIASAVHCIHELAIHVDDDSRSYIGYHHDLKPQNILVMNGSFMIADLGLARFKPSTCTSKTSLKWGTNLYGPPESHIRLQGARPVVGRQYDIWSLGCIFAEIVTFVMLGPDGLHGFSAKRTTVNSQINSEDDWFHDMRVVKPQVEEWFAHLITLPSSDALIRDLLRLISTMLNSDPGTRPRSRSVLDQLTNLIEQAEQAEDSKNDQIQDHLQPFKTERRLLNHQMWIAIYELNIEKVKRFLKCGSDPLWCDEHSNSPLHYAAANGNLQLLRLFLSFIDDVDGALAMESSIGRNAFHIAANAKAVAVIEYILTFNTARCLCLLQKQDIYGSTALHLAAESGCLGTFTLMIKAIDWEMSNALGILQISDNKGMTVLHWASRGGHLHIADSILCYARRCLHGVTIILESQDDYGRVPLDLALIYNHHTLYQMLKELGQKDQGC